jgi:hypothetical protein
MRRRMKIQMLDPSPWTIPVPESSLLEPLAAVAVFETTFFQL